MTFDWASFAIEVDFTDFEKSLIREVANRFITTGEGIPDQQKRNILGKDRRVLDKLIQDRYIRNVSNRYYPAFPALFFVSPELRARCGNSIERVLVALQRLFKTKPHYPYSLSNIADAANNFSSELISLDDVRIGAQFLQDFPSYCSNLETSRGDPVSVVHVTENILDFESLQQAWKDELARRNPPPPVPSPHPTLPTSSTTSRTVDFEFVVNEKLRRIIERDYGELERIKPSNALKSRIVLAGGLIEAFLLDALLIKEEDALAAVKASKEKGDKVKPLAEWHLSSLIDVARELKLISADAEKHSSTIREYRNLVHPGLEIRARLGVREEVANIAEQVLSLVIQDLRQRLHKSQP